MISLAGLLDMCWINHCHKLVYAYGLCIWPLFQWDKSAETHHQHLFVCLEIYLPRHFFSVFIKNIVPRWRYCEASIPNKNMFVCDLSSNYSAEHILLHTRYMLNFFPVLRCNLLYIYTIEEFLWKYWHSGALKSCHRKLELYK